MHIHYSGRRCITYLNCKFIHETMYQISSNSLHWERYNENKLGNFILVHRVYEKQLMTRVAGLRIPSPPLRNRHNLSDQYSSNTNVSLLLQNIRTVWRITVYHQEEKHQMAEYTNSKTSHDWSVKNSNY